MALLFCLAWYTCGSATFVVFSFFSIFMVEFWITLCFLLSPKPHTLFQQSWHDRTAYLFLLVQEPRDMSMKKIYRIINCKFYSKFCVKNHWQIWRVYQTIYIVSFEFHFAVMISCDGHSSYDDRHVRICKGQSEKLQKLRGCNCLPPLTYTSHLSQWIFITDFLTIS